METLVTEQRPWGSFEVLYSDPHTWCKVLHLDAQASLSLQLHHHRKEYWVALDEGVRGTINGKSIDLAPGGVYTVDKQVLHRLTNTTNAPVSVLEIATGAPDENDIERISDKYGRT